jgi:hypothetical protein
VAAILMPSAGKLRLSKVITIDAYPQLAQIAWNRKVRTIDEEEALALYEGNRAWVARDAMTADEAAFLEGLVARLGKGVWLG